MMKDMPSSWGEWLKIAYVAFAFCLALFLGALKSIFIGPIAGLILIVGNIGVILGLFPSHVVWTIYTLIKMNKFDTALKIAMLVALPGLFCIWLGLSIAGSVLLGVGYGFFTPWIATFEGFRHENESMKFFHCVVDGTWDTIRDSCTVVRDFADMLYHTYPLYLKELRESPSSNEIQPLKFILVPGCIIVGILGLVVEIPLYTAIAIVKSPYMLFKGWQRLTHDLISREGPFLETACIPIAGLTILLWPLIVIVCILLSIFTSVFIGLYGSVIVYQERSITRGIAYVIAMVAEFDEYTNDWLYLREGSILPRPRYRKKKINDSSEFSVKGSRATEEKIISIVTEPPVMVMPSLSSSKSVREAIQEVKMVQVWGEMMRSCEINGQELLDKGIIKPGDLQEWLKSKQRNIETSIVGVGLPCYSFLQTILHSIRSGSNGLLMHHGLELNSSNKPQDRLLDWIFHPILVLKEQIKALKLNESETRYLEKIVLFGNENANLWENEGLVPQDPLRAAQIQGISRRMMGMVRGVSKLPTYRRRYRHVVKALLVYSLNEEGEGSLIRTMSLRSVASSV